MTKKVTKVDKTPIQSMSEVLLQYLTPSGLISVSIGVLLGYFTKLPAEVVSAITGLVFAITNTMMVFVVESAKTKKK